MTAAPHPIGRLGLSLGWCCITSTLSLAAPPLSGLDTAAATVDPSLACTTSSVGDLDYGRTASWVHDESPFSPSPEATSFAPDDPATTMNCLPACPASPPRPSSACSDPPVASNAEDQRTSRFGRVIRPVCCLIESMTQLESILGVEPNPCAVIHV